jgi:tetratricopeptide (TPR) repeat protein
MSLKEIEKLREKVEKDPNSKLFVPLAEEYRKEGMLDEAIEILQKGLERQPSYMSARVSLGKIYLEKGQLAEARIEFENVIKAIPDNLYAHKKLSEIYRNTGERDLAIKAFRAVLKLNPMDEENLINLRELEGTSAQRPAEKIQEASGRISEEAAAVEETAPPFEDLPLELNSHEQEQGKTAQPAEEMDAFKESLFGVEAEAGEEIPEEMAAGEEDAAEGEGITEEAGEEWSFGDLESAPETMDVEEEGITEVAEITEEAEEKFSFGDIADILSTEGMEAVEGAEEISEDVMREEVTPEPAASSPEDNRELLQTADRYVEEENYLEAINTYRQILVSDPDDKSVLQRIEELKSLLRLLGKDKEVLISKLNAFLDAIKNRGDEFFRSS